MQRQRKKRDGLREIPDDLWELIKPLLPSEKPPKSNGRPQVLNRTVLDAGTDNPNRHIARASGRPPATWFA